MPNTHTGPSAAESRLLAVCDTFYHLLSTGQRAAAAALAYELDTVAQQYTQSQQKATQQHDKPCDNRSH